MSVHGWRSARPSQTVSVTVIDEDGERHARMTHEATGIDGLVGYLKWVGSGSLATASICYNLVKPTLVVLLAGLLRTNEKF